VKRFQEEEEEMEDNHNNMPIIIGSGLSGMAISDVLSQHGISHVMLGAPPNDLPRLGESIDPAGTLELLKFYPQFDDVYYKKRWITVFLGDYATSCNFDQGWGRIVGLRLLGFDSPAQFIHVDRVAFDNAFYEKVVADDHCRQFNSLVTDIAYNQETDIIEELHLANGETLSPSYVFDGTNHIRLLGRSLNIPIEFISDPQRVVYTHYHAPEGTPSECLFDDEWKHATNVLRHYKDLDGLDGVAWAIPLGSYISVGTSMPVGGNEFSDDEVMKLLEEAYARRGLDFVDTFSNPRPTMSVPRQQYFIHERGYGQNWLMAGPSFGQVWFPSASGVGAALVAGQIAPQILKSPLEAGEAYEGYIRGLVESHKTFDRMIGHHHSMMTAELVKKESNGIVGENVKRVARLAAIQNGPVAGTFARLLLKAVNREGTAASGCKVWKADLADQTREIFSEA